MKINELFEKFNKIMPESLAETWDCVGPQLTFHDIEVKSVLVALEITPEVVEEAIVKGVEAILIHHPIIFSPLQSLDSKNCKNKMLINLIQNKISVYAAHTNYDKLKDGNNDYLAKQLALNNISFLEESNGIVKKGTLDTVMTLKEFVIKICHDTYTPENQVRYVGNDETKIKKIALCTGSGAEYYKLALEEGCDCFVTGDIKYHDAQDAKTYNFSLVDLGHYHSEKSFSISAANLCKNNIGSVIFVSSSIDINPFTVL
ncbi:Nif3-like dinuclear metal center hexameric protein [Eubacteriales bacterium KG127]